MAETNALLKRHTGNRIEGSNPSVSANTFLKSLGYFCKSPAIAAHAADAVEGVRWRRGAGEIRLVGGLMTPVSRTYAPTLKEAGWF